MKSNSFRLFLATAALGVFAVSAFAGPGPQYWETLRQKAQFEQLKPGEKVVFVCNQCKTVSEITIKSPEQAMEFCTEGTTLTCPSCKEKVKVTFRGPPKNPSTQRDISYTNEKGEECAFVAKVVADTDSK